MKGQLFTLDAFAAFCLAIIGLGLFLITLQNLSISRDSFDVLWDASQILVKDALVNDKTYPNNITWNEPKISEIKTLFNLSCVGLYEGNYRIKGDNCDNALTIKRPVVCNGKIYWLVVGK